MKLYATSLCIGMTRIHNDTSRLAAEMSCCLQFSYCPEPDRADAVAVL